MKRPGAGCKCPAALLDDMRAAVRALGYLLTWAPNGHGQLHFMVTPETDGQRTVPVGGLHGVNRFIENHRRWAARPHLGAERMRSWHRSKVRAMERRETRQAQRRGL